MNNFKKLITTPYNIGLSCLNYFQDKLSNQAKPEEFEGVKINLEEKEENMSFEDLVTSKHFPLEIHYVTTSDGYILRLFRIPGAKHEKFFEKKSTKKQPVLLVHGIFDSSDGWVCNDEDKCIPFILANLGYDVWLGNSRGNKHSRNHTSLSPEQKEFWDFSFHEMGLHDLPAFFEHILQHNKFSKKLIYIGHSQGTVQMFCALAQNQAYVKSKVKLFIAFGPVARTYCLESKLLHLMEMLKIDFLCEKLGFHEVLSHDENLNKLNSWIMPKIPFLSSLVMEIIADKGAHTINNAKRMSVYMSHQPSGSSLKAISHLVQLKRNGRFCAYDHYDKAVNLQKYGSEEPFDYDLRKVKEFPIVILYGKQDRLASEMDVEWLLDELGQNVIFRKMYEEMGHTTFMMSRDISWFEDIIKIIEMFKKESESENDDDEEVEVEQKGIEVEQALGDNGK